MNSPSRQCDFVPFEFPETQFLNPLALGWPLRIAALLEPAHCSAMRGGPTAPFVHWLRVPEMPDALAGVNDVRPGTSARAAAAAVTNGLNLIALFPTNISFLLNRWRSTPATRLQTNRQETGMPTSSGNRRVFPSR